MKTKTYQIVWDNGHASGVFSMVFPSKRQAEQYARDWKRDMIALDHDPKTAREDYQWELIETNNQVER